MTPGDDYARSMRDAGVRRRRRDMLGQSHAAPLASYAAKLRECGMGEVPEFDPFDGGIDARVLFLLEKPGPRTSTAQGGSGFISRNNDDPTAEATFNFMQQAGIPRRLTVIWNVIPWWNSTRKITGQELTLGASCVGDLAALLPKLRVVVLVGAKAATKAKPYFENTGIALLTSDHPSPQVRAGFRERWDAIPLKWAEVHRFV